MDIHDRYAAALCRRVAAVRASRGLTQSDLAAAAHLSLRVLQRIEAGSRDPSFREISRIAQALGCQPHRFVDLAEREARAALVAEQGAWRDGRGRLRRSSSGAM